MQLGLGPLSCCCPQPCALLPGGGGTATGWQADSGSGKAGAHAARPACPVFSPALGHQDNWGSVGLHPDASFPLPLLRRPLSLTSDTRPPHEYVGHFELWCGLQVTQDIRYHETSPRHLHPISVDKQLLPKRRTLQSCAPSALILRSFLRVGTASLTLPQCWGTHTCIPRLWDPPPLGALHPPMAASQQQLQGRWSPKARLSTCMACDVTCRITGSHSFWGGPLSTTMLLWKSLAD